MYHLIINENNYAKKQKQFKKVDGVFKSAGIDYELHTTTSVEDVRETVKEITSGKGNSVIIMGGDGTLHDALNSFVDFENNTMGLIPFGTGNDFAEAAHIPTDPEKAAKIIVANTPRRIDYIQFDSGLRSLNAIGMGIDVDVLQRAYSGKSTKRSKYLKALISSLAHFKSHDFTVNYNGKSESHYGLIGAVGNGIQFGGGIKCFPEAVIDDGELDLFIVDFISRFKIIGAFLKLMTGRINKVKQVTAVRVKEVEFIPHSEKYTIQADGELYENVPVKLHIEAAKLNFYLV